MIVVSIHWSHLPHHNVNIVDRISEFIELELEVNIIILIIINNTHDHLYTYTMAKPCMDAYAINVVPQYL